MNPNNPLEMLFDYVRIRFRTTEVKHIAEDILMLQLKYMIAEDWGFYSYSGQYHLGNIILFTSTEQEKGTLLEMKGQGCREFERFLLAQKRTWYDFFDMVFQEKGVIKRIDLAINDKIGILNIFEMMEKCDNDECISVFRSFKSYRSGELINSREQNKYNMGNTLYIGSLKSEVYFCVYQKDYEQFIKCGVPIEESEIKNRFEIRLKSERAENAIIDLLKHKNAEKTAFSIINRYVRFVDKDENKERSKWKTSKRWAWFIGKNRSALKLTTDPQPYTLEKTLNWLSKQVVPSWKMIQYLDACNDTNFLAEMVEKTGLTKRHMKIIAQQVSDVEEVIKHEEMEEVETIKNDVQLSFSL